MGHGCAYTCNEGDTMAYWLEVPSSGEQDMEDIEYEWLFCDIVNYFETHEELFDVVNPELYGAKINSSLYDITLESTYEGEGIIVKMEPGERLDPHMYNLAKANFDKNYHALGKRLKKKLPCSMRICAGNSWCSSEY